MKQKKVKKGSVCVCVFVWKFDSDTREMTLVL